MSAAKYASASFHATITATCFSLFVSFSASAATIFVSPSSLDEVKPGEQFSLLIQASDFANGTRGGGIDFSWDPNVVEIVSINDIDIRFPGDGFLDDEGTLSPGRLQNLTTASFNVVESTSFDIAEITFTAIARGETIINLSIGMFGPNAENVWSDGGSASPVDDLQFGSAAVTVVPLPASILLLPAALGLIGGMRKSHNK